MLARLHCATAGVVVNLSALLCCCSFTLEQVRDSADDIKDIEKQERTEKELRVRAHSGACFRPVHVSSTADDDNADNIPPMIQPNTLVFVLSDGTHAHITHTLCIVPRTRSSGPTACSLLPIAREASTRRC